jgi:hypothetical protein
MKPVGLTYKNITYNPYTKRTSGEIMIVHLCLGCNCVSCNRIAGDDNSFSILEILETPQNISIKGIRFLNKNDKKEVLISLFGY